jgi:transposase-like protein
MQHVDPRVPATTLAYRHIGGTDPKKLMLDGPVQYLNNIIEQDHRAIKRRVNAQQGFREFQAARRTIQGYEVIHMMRKGQVRWVSGTDIRRQNQFLNKVFERAA